MENNGKTRMTIHRALAELKLIDDKVAKNLKAMFVVGINQKDKKINGYLTSEEFANGAKSVYDSTADLIKRKGALKAAIVAINGVTKIKIGEREMTIADAITEKTNIVLKKGLLAALQTSFNAATAELNKRNDQVEKNVQLILEASFGKENVKPGSDDVENIRKPYITQNEWHLCDPLKAEEKIKALEAEIAEFEMEVDAKLSEINAITFIEI